MSDKKEQPQIPIGQAIIYSLGYFGVTVITYAVAQIPQLLYIPTQGEALIPDSTLKWWPVGGVAMFGLLNGFGRIIDAVVDPWIGNLSDYWKSKWGRRKPFIALGTPLMGIFLVLFTFPTPEPSIRNLIWLMLIYPLFFTFYTVAVTPYLAIFPEITSTTKGRLLTTTLLAVNLLLGSIVGVMLIYAMQTGMVISIGSLEHKVTFTSGAILTAIISSIPMLIVALFVKTPAEPAIEDIPKRPGTWSQVKDTLGYAPFRIYLFSMMAFWFAFEVLKNSAMYVADRLFGNAEAYIGILMLALVVAIACGAGAYWLGRTIGKRKSIIIMGLGFAFLLPFIGLLGIGPFKTPETGYLLFGLMGLPIAIMLVIPKSLLADIIDCNRDECGIKREALFFASQALVMKTGVAFSKMFMNFLLPIGAIGCNAVGDTGVRLIGPVAGIFVFIGLLLFFAMPDIEHD